MLHGLSCELVTVLVLGNDKVFLRARHDGLSVILLGRDADSFGVDNFPSIHEPKDDLGDQIHRRQSAVRELVPSLFLKEVRAHCTREEGVDADPVQDLVVTGDCAHKAQYAD